jgi:phosphohistidine phosphatase SixA
VSESSADGPGDPSSHIARRAGDEDDALFPARENRRPPLACGGRVPYLHPRFTVSLGEESLESTVIVLRHAAAGDRAAWPGVDRARPLDRVGLAQSLELTTALDGLPIGSIWTSPFVRCQQTVAAIAALRRLPVNDRHWLAEGVTAARVEQGLATVDGDVLLCTHGETARLVRGVLAADRPLDDLAKGAAWVFRLAGGVVASVEHMAAPAGAALVPELATARH